MFIYLYIVVYINIFIPIVKLYISNVFVNIVGLCIGISLCILEYLDTSVDLFLSQYLVNQKQMSVPLSCDRPAVQGLRCDASKMAGALLIRNAEMSHPIEVDLLAEEGVEGGGRIVRQEGGSGGERDEGLKRGDACGERGECFIWRTITYTRLLINSLVKQPPPLGGDGALRWSARRSTMRIAPLSLLHLVDRTGVEWGRRGGLKPSTSVERRYVAT